MNCPLCESEQIAVYHSDAARTYVRCRTCDLISVPAEFQLSDDDERDVYDLHENDPTDRGYRAFLARTVDPLVKLLPGPSEGLDFGCGPGPALPQMLADDGHQVVIYDKFYAADLTVFDRSYDFACATEVFEHLSNPRFEVARLWSLLRPGGFLAVMTKRHDGLLARFKAWHYTHDPTHVCFWSDATVDWLAAHLNADQVYRSNDVFILQK